MADMLPGLLRQLLVARDYYVSTESDSAHQRPLIEPYVRISRIRLSMITQPQAFARS